MRVTEFLDEIPLLGVYLASWMITVLSIEFGLRMGQLRRSGLTGEEKLYTGTSVSVSLTLLAFMLAIVFGAVASRVGELKRVALDEANAIGTAHLRADLLPEADRVEIQQLLRDYVTLRTEISQSGPEQQFEQAIGRSKQLRRDLWSRAITAVEQQPTRTSALFVQSLNELINMHERRVTVGIHYRLPGIVWIMLYVLLILAMAMGGYDTGVSGSHRSIVLDVALALAFSGVLILAVGLDRPHQHLSTATETAMFELQEDIRGWMRSQP